MEMSKLKGDFLSVDPSKMCRAPALHGRVYREKCRQQEGQRHHESPREDAGEHNLCAGLGTIYIAAIFSRNQFGLSFPTNERATTTLYRTQRTRTQLCS